jgi:membrane protease YdiL (CAAX protease family)
VSEQAAEPATGYLPAARWSLPQFLLVFGIGLGASLVATIVAATIAGGELSVTAFAMVFGAQSLGSLGTMWWLSRTKGSGSMRDDFGLRLELSDSWAIFAGFGLQIAVALLTAPLVYLFFGDDPPQQQVSEITGSSSGLGEALLIVAAVGLLAPLTEEMMFRGMLLSRSARALSRTASIIVTAAAFAIVHLLDPSVVVYLPGLFLIGVVLALVSLRRGDLSLAIPIHAGVNLTAALLLLFGDELTRWAEEQQEQLQGLIHLFL